MRIGRRRESSMPAESREPPSATAPFNSVWVSASIYFLAAIQLVRRGSVRGEVHDAEGAGADDVDHRAVIVDFLEHGLYGLQLREFAMARLLFHLFELVVERELLVTVEVGEAVGKLKCGTDTLKKCGQLLDGRLE